MKIYFEDGRLKSALVDACVFDYAIDARDGYSVCDYLLDSIANKSPDSTVYTNFLSALDNRYAWNSELKVPEIYIRDKNYEFVRIDTLTARELREAHNIEKMYVANEFGNFS